MTPKSTRAKWHKGGVMLDKSECVQAEGRLDKDGYGKRKVAGRTYRAHRLAYCEANGIQIEEIDGLCVMHECDNPSCVNPKHLSVGSNLENVRDMVSKDRQSRGEDCGNAKLTEEEVLSIRQEYQRYSRDRCAKVFAERYGVSRRAIAAIVCGKTWVHL